jgi:DNA-directed RNA polymerase II subunit RPB2
MDTTRHVLRTLFRDTTFPLVQHHVESFNAFLETSIPRFVKVSNPFELELSDGRYIRVYIGGKSGDGLVFRSPVDDIGDAVVPHTCRLDNLTYAVTITGTIDVEYVFPEGKSETRTFENIPIGKLPLMLRSKMCYLTGLDGYSVGECKFEQGGYFIVDGAEKVLLTQELLGNNMFYSGKRDYTPRTAKDETAKEIADRKEREAGENAFVARFAEQKETFVGIKSISEDGSRGPYSHFLIVPPESAYTLRNGHPVGEHYGKDRRVAFITLPGFIEPVPLLSVFRALGVSSDRDLYDMVLATVVDKDRRHYDDIFRQLILSHESYLRVDMAASDLVILEQSTKRKYKTEVVENLYDLLFPHIGEEGQDAGTLFRRKAYMLAHMTKMALDVSLGRAEPSDRDNIQFKRLNTSGDLCFQEFRRIYREMGKSLLLNMDSRIQFERKTYEGRGVLELIKRETIGRYWRSNTLINQFVKSFKGQWGGKNGISQELSRLSYIGYLSHLRRTNLQIDPSMNSAPPRRLYASQYGLMCPVDSPDGSGVGYIKALATFARISNASPSATVKKALLDSGIVRAIADVHPSTVKPLWTPLFVNSELFGVCVGDTEALHRKLVGDRRSGALSSEVSLAWNRLENTYTIATDAGRPIRPVYREGTDSAAVLAAKTWDAVAKTLDYIDAPETAVSRLSLSPFDKTHRSELHMTFVMSAIANLVPFSDHNPGPRNVFSIAQQKQACAWYHTNFMKRFDTIATFLTMPQKPLSQTWMYREIMGAGGCLPYGENALVAITTYGGHNQEDSVMLNSGSLRRGMFHTLYFHSYDLAESMFGNPGQQKPDIENLVLDPSIKTTVGNLILNPLYKDAVARKEGMNYELLDADGYIKVNSIIDENTILMGLVTPIVSGSGQITGYRDVSETTKRGQHGRIDAVYRYTLPNGLKGVKIRVVEERSPVPGDKMASRHSQKGTCGMLMPEEDMPFTARGVRPDILFNPHALPTRMTVGQFLESSCSRLGLDLGTFIDATPFTVSNRVADLKETMIARGFEPYGSDILYNGLTGEMMGVDIFMGPVYYQRLKHMVEDKINYRSTGPKKLLTHQPVQGRSNNGGLALGEMERDGLIAHGMSKFLNESFMDRSDKAEVQFDRENQRFDTSRETLTIPFAMSVFAKELEAMHISVNIQTSE